MASPTNGSYITRGVWIQEVTDPWADLYAPWQSYTPTWTATAGTTDVGINGSLNGSYKVIGSTVLLRLRLVIGSGASLGNTSAAWSLGLPPGFAPAFEQTMTGWISNQPGSIRHPCSAWLTPANGIERVGTANNIVGQAQPFAWANQDQLVLGGEYEWA